MSPGPGHRHRCSEKKEWSASLSTPWADAFTQPVCKGHWERGPAHVFIVYPACVYLNMTLKSHQ